MELLVAVAIVAVLLGIGVPAFTTVTTSLRLQSVIAQLQSDLSLARVEAIKRNLRVLICTPNSDGTGCGANIDWGTAGWLICYDSDSDGACDAASSGGTNPNPIVVRRSPSEAISLVGTAAVIRFNANGTSAAGSGIIITARARSGARKSLLVAGTGQITKQ